MKYHNKKLRSTIIDNDECELLLIKQCAYAAVSGFMMVSYKNITLFDPFDGYQGDAVYIVNKVVDGEEAATSFRVHQLGEAVDYFIAQFIHEDSCSLSKLLIEVHGVGIPWTTIKQTVPIGDLLDSCRFRTRVELLATDLQERRRSAEEYDDETDRTTTRRNSITT